MTFNEPQKRHEFNKKSFIDYIIFWVCDFDERQKKNVLLNNEVAKYLMDNY